MRRTTAWGSIRSSAVRLAAHPAIGCAVASSSGKGRRRFTWNCDSQWWSVRPAPTTAAARRLLTSSTTRQTPTRPRPPTHPGWRTRTPRYIHAHPLISWPLTYWTVLRDILHITVLAIVSATLSMTTGDAFNLLVCFLTNSPQRKDIQLAVYMWSQAFELFSIFP